MNCNSCNKRLKPIAIIAGERFYYECDVCGASVCEKCCAVDYDGACECIDCIQTRVRRKYNLLEKLKEGK